MIGVFIMDKNMLDRLVTSEKRVEEIDALLSEPNITSDLKRFKDPDVRYYACVVDKNRAGAKPKVVFRLNLAYNFWEELGYLKLKTKE